MTRRVGRVLVIGLDSATFDLLGPWIDKGALPSLSGLLEQGVSCELRSTVPPHTAPAWSSFMTGKNPGKHGVFGFMKLSDDLKNLRLTSSVDRHAEDLWEVLSRNGKKVAVIRVPVTYPPRAVNGILVGGFMTPPRAGDYVYPPTLKGEIEREIGSLNPTPSSSLVRRDLEESIIEDLMAQLDKFGRGLPNLLTKEDWDFFMVVFQGTDEVQHRFWHLSDPSHPRFDRDKSAKYGDVVLRYYQRVDAIVSSLLSRTDPTTTTVLVLSDHGARALHKWVSLNNIFWRHGLLAFRKNPWTRLKLLLFRAGLTPVNLFSTVLKLHLAGVRDIVRREDARSRLRRFTISLSDLDWSRTQVYALGGWGQVYVNPNAVGERDYDSVRRKVTELLLGFTDPDSGQSIFNQSGVKFREELYHGPHLDKAPDIVALPDAPYQGYADYEFGFNSPVMDSVAISGTHAMNGILILRGPSIKKGIRLPAASIVDVAPTIFYLLELPIPGDMDGTVLSKAIDNQHIGSKPPTYSNETAQSNRASFSYSSDEEERLKKSLRDLGYL